jgi:hypothetical protein
LVEKARKRSGTQMRFRIPALAALTLAVGVAVGCGGASDTKSSAGDAQASGAKKSSSLSLVAYSTPQVV